ncbi:serine palmitoyltransferase 1 [Harpegnathos saltator]|uniref:Serine palmitoyltransferase 1 n=1 Tax=Harpegnathos saltator TaxID=610380 RepID=E2BWC6_HARSA|nr:serine palmitoyltransferase 1 [Harpegnathos saltator]EFN80030.1 Serine palmitoyltransferase 1 [Harpegnathos saltator]
MSTKFLFTESTEILNVLPHYHTLLKTILVISLVWFISKRRKNNSIPSDELVESKLAEWQPEPLIGEPPKEHPSLNPKYVNAKIGRRIIINGKNCLNLGTHNYLNLSNDSKVEESAVAAVEKYGVGSCGPRAFYGTVDVHLELEERLAKFTNTEEAVIYSYGFSAIASAIGAYCKRNDLIFVDEQVNFAIQKGLDASRANIQYFKHNDVQDLHNLLIKQADVDKQNPKKAAKTKRFLIIEGIYNKTGSICPLPELLDLCKQYKLRIFIDESISLGTLGPHGKGVTEYFNIPITDIDMIMGSLESAFGSIGGFCVGTSFVIEHQRLSGLGYCFSASLPPFLSSIAIACLDIIENNLQIFQSLKNNALAVDSGLKSISAFECPSFAESPMKHLYLKDKKDYATEEKLLCAISNKCIENNLAVILPAYLEAEILKPRPSIKLCVSTDLSKNDIDFALDTLKKCAEEVLSCHVIHDRNESL